MKIENIYGYQVFDSRGFPTVEAEVNLESGHRGRGTTPSGASIGQYEALDLRDGGTGKFRGKSVYRSVANINGEIAAALKGRSALDQTRVDDLLVTLDSTPDKSRLGANSILAVSMAVATAAAAFENKLLYERIGGGHGSLLPIPQTQIIGGGAHAAGRIDLQDLTVLPIGADTFEGALEVCFNIYQAAGDLLTRKGKRHGIADEGGYWPDFATNEEAIVFALEAIEEAGYAAGIDASLSLDIAASGLFDRHSQEYCLRLDNHCYSSDEFAELITQWCHRYPILSIEDPMAENDWGGWKNIFGRIGQTTQIIGDDLFTTNYEKVQRGVRNGCANAVLIKLNQVGTVTETLHTIRLAQDSGWLPVISARSGETEDTFIAHLAVATNAGQLKVGAFARSERTAKWNELIRIARHLGPRAVYAGGTIFNKRKGEKEAIPKGLGQGAGSSRSGSASI